MDSNNEAMENVQGTSANKFATITDLQELLHTVQLEFARLSGTNNLEHYTTYIAESNNDIQALY